MVDDVIDALMDDGISAAPQERVKSSLKEKTGKGGVRSEIKGAKRLSEVELSVLRALRDTKKVRLISRITGYPEVVVTRAIERLIEKGYLDEELNILREPEITGRRVRKSRRSGKLLFIDIAIAIVVLILIIAVAYYFFS